MFFNPLFLQAINTGETASAAKSMKPGGTQYLFSDIIKVCINKDSARNGSASLQIPGQEITATGGAALTAQSMTSGLSVKEIVEFLSGKKIQGNTAGSVSADGLLNTGMSADTKDSDAGDIALFKLGASGLTGIRLNSGEALQTSTPGGVKPAKNKSKNGETAEIFDSAKVNGLQPVIPGTYSVFLTGPETVATAETGNGNCINVELDIDELRDLLNQIVSDNELGSEINIEVITADGKTAGLEELAGSMLTQLSAGQFVWTGRANIASAGNAEATTVNADGAATAVNGTAVQTTAAGQIIAAEQTTAAGNNEQLPAADKPVTGSESEKSLSGNSAAIPPAQNELPADENSSKTGAAQKETPDVQNAAQPVSSEQAKNAQTGGDSYGNIPASQNNTKPGAGKQYVPGPQQFSGKEVVEKAAESVMQGGVIQVKNGNGDTVRIHARVDIQSAGQTAGTDKSVKNSIGDFRIPGQQMYASAAGTVKINESADAAYRVSQAMDSAVPAESTKGMSIQSPEAFPGAQTVSEGVQLPDTAKTNPGVNKSGSAADHFTAAANPANLTGAGSEAPEPSEGNNTVTEAKPSVAEKQTPAVPVSEAAAGSIKGSESATVQPKSEYLSGTEEAQTDIVAQPKDSVAAKDDIVTKDGAPHGEAAAQKQTALPEENENKLKGKQNSGKNGAETVLSGEKENASAARYRTAEGTDGQPAANTSGSTQQKQQFEDFRSISGKIREFHENSMKLRDSGNIQSDGTAPALKSNRKLGSEDSKPDGAGKHINETESRQAAVQEKSKSDNSGEKSKQSPENYTAENSSAEKSQTRETRTPESSAVQNLQEATGKNSEVHIKEKQSVLHGSVPDKTVKAIEVIKEITKFMQHGDRSQMVLKIDPENLGLVKIALETVDTMLNASIEVENEAAKKLVETNLPQLHASLNQSGVHLNSLNISLADSGQKNEAQQKGGQKRKQQLFNETISEEDNTQPAEKQLGYNTYEYLA